MKIGISACLVDYPYRYNAEDVSLESLKLLGREFELVPFCPEVSANLGVPREPIRFVKRNGGVYLLRTSDARPLYGRIKRAVLNFLKANPELRAFILKSKSPSCGIASAKVYKNLHSEEYYGRTWGILPKLLKGRNILIVEERHLLKERNYREFKEILQVLKGFYSEKSLSIFHRRFCRKLRELSPYWEKELRKSTDSPSFYKKVLLMLLSRRLKKLYP